MQLERELTYYNAEDRQCAGILVTMQAASNVINDIVPGTTVSVTWLDAEIQRMGGDPTLIGAALWGLIEWDGSAAEVTVTRVWDLLTAMRLVSLDATRRTARGQARRALELAEDLDRLVAA